MSRIEATAASIDNRRPGGGGRGRLRQNRDIAAAAPGHGCGTVVAMTENRSLPTALSGLLLLMLMSLLVVGCGGQSPANDAADATDAAAGGLSKVLLLGDSIAAGEALPLAAAFEASGVGFKSIAADGGGNVIGPFSGHNWKQLPGQIAAARPDLVLYQLTTYDWGSKAEQEAAYRRLLKTVTAAGAKLDFVTFPPLRPDDFYRPHIAELDHAADAARAVAASSAGAAKLLDAEAVWGDSYQREREGIPDRSSDGIHTCPQGAARFSDWLLTELASAYPDFEPAAPSAWANTGWSGDKRFEGC